MSENFGLEMLSDVIHYGKKYLLKTFDISSPDEQRQYVSVLHPYKTKRHVKADFKTVIFSVSADDVFDAMKNHMELLELVKKGKKWSDT